MTNKQNIHPQYRKGVRESLRTGSTLFDAVVTHYTAKPLPGQLPYFKPNARRAFWISLAGLIAFPLLVSAINAFNFGAALVASYFAAIIMTGLFRKFQVEYGHHASHRTFIRGDREANSFYLNLATTIAFCQNGAEYRKEHNEHHDRSIFTTEHDADAALLLKFGIHPGKSKTALWLTLIGNLFSPYFHGYFLWQRVRSNFITRTPLHWRFVAAAWVLVLIATPFILPAWVAIVTILLPATLFYQMSALCQFTTEHAWLLTSKAPQDTQLYADRCWGRFMGEPLPSEFLAWPGFLLRHVFLHFPGRYAIIVGDMPAHDWHHLAGYMGLSSHNWPAGIYERERAIEGGDPYGLGDRELWGIIPMLDHIFTLFAATPFSVEEDKQEHANTRSNSPRFANEPLSGN